MGERPVVRVKQGQLRGKVATDHNSQKYYSFQGIPYAKPPIGKLRFKAPQPIEPWTDIKDATEEGSDCYARHMILQTLKGSEDCLFLNVYTPSLPSTSSKLLPVMVWIHGGAFTTGSGSSEVYSPDFLLPHNVVLVTINYRTGLLGFLNFEDQSLGIPGNAGLKDQVLALKWVKDNIASFNGDPKNVTVFGESAGGASVNYLILSPMAKGLFEKAIIQSGSAISPWAMGTRLRELIAKVLNCQNASDKKIFELLEKLDSKELIKLQQKIPDSVSIGNRRHIGPVVEVVSSEEAFITEHPLNIIKSGKYNKVPVMIGFCSREGLLMDMTKQFLPKVYQTLNSVERNIPYSLKLNRNKEIVDRVAEDIRNFYFGGKEVGELGSTQLYLLNGDMIFVKHILDTAKYFLVNSNNPVYIYRVSIETKLNIFKQVLQVPNSGVSHADDLFYLFKNSMTPHLDAHSLEAEAVHRFTKLWTTFAHHGNPNPKDDDPLINVTWPEAEKGKLHYLDIGENLTVGVNPEYSRMAFWDEIFKKYAPASKL